MNFETKTITFAVLIPAAVSIAVAYGVSRISLKEAVRSWAGAMGCAAGFFAGFALLETGNLRPTTYWHWLPWLGAAAMLVGPLPLVSRISPTVSWTAWLIVAVAAAWFLVPNWSDLRPRRDVYVAVFATSVFMLAVFLDLLADRTPAALLSVTLIVAATTVAVLLTVFVSLRFGLLALAAVSGFSGCGIASLRSNSRNVVRGTVLFYAVVVGGWMLTGQLAAVLPAVCFPLVLAAPLVLWVRPSAWRSQTPGK